MADEIIKKAEVLEDEGDAEETDFDFVSDDEELFDDESEDLIPSVLFKGITRPKTEDDWRKLLLEANPQRVPEYVMTEDYREGDLILHPKFGLGVVSKVITKRKMEVVYETSKRLMAKCFTPPEEV